MTTYQLPLLADFGSQGGLAGHVALALQRGATDHEVEDVLRLTFAVAAKEGDPTTVIAALDILDRCLQALREAGGAPDRAAGVLLRGPDPDLCPYSKRVDLPTAHSWVFDGDDPYTVCCYCGQRRDSLSGRVIPDA